MSDLYAECINAVRETLQSRGENVNDYNVNAVISPLPILHGAIVRDFKLMRNEGHTVRAAWYLLAKKYKPYTEESIHTIIVRAKRAGIQGLVKPKLPSQTDEEKKRRNILYGREWRKRNINKAKIQDQLNCAIKKGEIIRPTICQSCGREGKIHAHHFNYNHYLNFIWVCAKCHGRIHHGKRVQT